MRWGADSVFRSPAQLWSCICLSFGLAAGARGLTQRRRAHHTASLGAMAAHTSARSCGPGAPPRRLWALSDQRPRGDCVWKWRRRRQGVSKNNSQKRGAGREDDASVLLPFSSDLRQSAATRALREESAGCVYGARGESHLFCFPYRKGREGRREGKGGGILPWTRLTRSSRKETVAEVRP